MNWNHSLTGVLDQLDAELKNVMATHGGLGRVEELPLNNLVSDSNSKFLIRLPNGEPAAILAVASDVAPSSVSIAAACAQSAKDAVGSELGECILTPWVVSAVEGISYSIAPYCRPFYGNKAWYRFQRWRLSTPVLEWLYLVVAQTRTLLGSDECRKYFMEPLFALASNAAVPGNIRAQSESFANRVDRGSWVPRHVLAHNDLWVGNLLHSPLHSRYPFVVIDWGGARMRGHAIYDLLRLARSLSLTESRVHREIKRHCVLLECSEDCARGYLLAAFGQLSMNLGEWPESRFIKTMIDMVESLDQCVGTFEKPF